MKLIRLTLRDVGVYAGTHTIEFSTLKTKPITLVGGFNGAGKTTLLDSIGLCLYGTRARHLLKARRYEDHLRKLINHDANPADGAAITLEFARNEDGRERTYKVERSWRLAPSGAIVEDVDVSIDGQLSATASDNWSVLAESILPMSLSGLVFFDGEKIEALADVTQTASVFRETLEIMLGLDLVSRTQADLTEYVNRVGKEAQQVKRSVEYETLFALRQELRQKVDTLSDERKSLQAAVEEAQQAFDEAIAEVSRTGADTRSEEDLRDALARVQNLRDETRDQIVRVVAGKAPLLLLPDLVAEVAHAHDAAVALRDREALHVLVADTVEAALARMSQLSQQTHQQVRDAFVDVIDDQADLAPPPFQVDPVAGIPASQLTEVGFQAIAKEAGDLLHDFDELTVQQDDLTKQLEDALRDEHRHDVLAAADGARAHLAALQARLADTDDALRKRSRELEGVERRTVHAAVTNAEASLAGSDNARKAREAEDAIQALDVFKVRVTAHHADTVAKSITSELRRLLRKQGLVRKVEIKPETLTPLFFDHNGDSVDPPSMSAGERQLLAAAILSGILRASNRTLPMVIDTPMGRLDSSHRHNFVTGFLPNASHQVVLLSTDEEIVDDYYDALSTHVGRNYLLDYDDTDGCTQVREGYFE